MKSAPCGKGYDDVLRIKAARMLSAVEIEPTDAKVDFARDMAGAFIACCDCFKGIQIIGCEYMEGIKELATEEEYAS